MTEINTTDHTATCTPGTKQLAWVIYRFPLMADKDITLIEAGISSASEQQLYLGLANYSRGTWEWHAVDMPITDQDHVQPVRLSLEPKADYLSPTGSIYYVVACWDDEQCRIMYSCIYYALKDVYVMNLQASDGASAQEITITWDALEGASGYELYYRVYWEPVPLTLLADIDGGGVTSFSHTTTSPAGMEAVPGTLYMYYIGAKFSDGSTSWLSHLWDIGYLAAP